jgi:hypothetical protein
MNHNPLHPLVMAGIHNTINQHASKSVILPTLQSTPLKHLILLLMITYIQPSLLSKILIPSTLLLNYPF